MLLILILNLLIISHTGKKMIHAINVENTINVLMLFQDSSIQFNKNLSIWFVVAHKNEANIAKNIAKVILLCIVKMHYLNQFFLIFSINVLSPVSSTFPSLST